jgi:c-di-GMP-binding flagellar brake protein YcgR
MSTPEGPERRKSERRGLRTTATILLGQTHSFEVRTVDISATGMGIVASANPKPGTVLDIRFSIPFPPNGQLPFESKARVVHSVFSSNESGFKIGLTFIDLPPNSAAAALRYVG